MDPLVTIILQASERWDATERCLEAVAAHTPEAHELVVVSGGPEVTADRRRAWPQALFVSSQDTATSRGRARNQGAAQAHAPTLVFLDADTLVRPGWLGPLLEALSSHPGAGLAGPVRFGLDGRIHDAGLGLAYGMGEPLQSFALHKGSPSEALRPERATRTGLGASCLAVRATVFRALEGFDEAYLAGGEEMDLCLRAREKGHESVLVPRAHVTTAGPEREPHFDHLRHDSARLHAEWLGRAERFDLDVRRELAAVAPRPGSTPREPVTVLSFLLPSSLPWVAPWLEATRATLGPDDPWILVDASQDETISAYARWLAPQETNARRLEAPDVAFSQLWAFAHAHVSTELVACVGPNHLPSWHWLERATAHLAANRHLGAVTASLPPFGTTGPALSELETSVMDQALWPVTQGQSLPSQTPETLTFVARRFGLGTPTDDGPIFEPTRPHSLADALASKGLFLVTGLDVCSRRLDGVALPPGAFDSTRRVLSAQAANLGWEDLWRRARGRVDTKHAQTLAHRHGVLPYTDPVSIVVPVYNEADLTRAFLESLYAHTHRAFEVIVVDNGSSPAVAGVAQTFAARYGNLVYLRNEINEGFAFACNQGLARASGGFAVVINNDVRVPEGWLGRLLAAFEGDAAVGIVGPVTNRCVGQQQVMPPPYARLTDFPGAAAARALTHRGGTLDVGRLVGLCLMIRRDVLDKIGGFDPAFGYGNFEDDDYCQRARRAGYRLSIVEDVLLHHEGSATFTSAGFDARALARQNWEIFCDKWQHDPARARFSDLEALAGAQPFDADRDSIPLSFAALFDRAAPDLPLSTRKPFRLLLCPDVETPHWMEPVRVFLDTFSTLDPVALVLRPVPPTPARLARAHDEVLAFLNAHDKPEGWPDVVLEATPLIARARPRIYASVNAVIATDGPQAPFVARETLAMGLPLIEATAASMRQVCAPPGEAIA